MPDNDSKRGTLAEVARTDGYGGRDRLASCAGSARPAARPPRSSRATPSSPAPSRFSPPLDRPPPPVSPRCRGIQFSDATSIKLRLDCHLREIGELIPSIGTEARLAPVQDLLSALRSSFGHLATLVNDPSRLTALRAELVEAATASLNVARYLPVMVSRYPQWSDKTQQGLQLLTDLFRAMGGVIGSSEADRPAALQRMSAAREAVLRFDPRLFTVP